MPQPVFVRCKVKGGMFSDEAVVEIPRKDGKTAFFTVLRSDLQGDRLRATLLGGSLVRIPTVYPVTLAVADEALERA